MKKIEKELDEVEISTSIKIMFSVADILKHWNVSYFHNNFKRSGIIMSSLFIGKLLPV